MGKINHMKKILVVGAGLSGAVVARQLAEAGHDVHVVDSRLHVAGNCHSERDQETGIMVHKHGPHIFHTDNQVVWDYVNEFAEFVDYTLRVKATTQDKVFSLPINLLTINQFFGHTFSPKQAKEFIDSIGDKSIIDAKSFKDQALKFLGNDLYEAFFKYYPLKQWGIDPAELPASVLTRLPIRFDYNDNYFAHKYQGIPEHGYTELVKNILDHKNITVSLNTPFDKSIRSDFDHTFFSGKLDSWFDYSEGELGYRTLRFEESRHDDDFQGCAVMSYPGQEVPYTRIVEHKHFTPWEEHERTIIYKEHSSLATCDDVPYYPIRLVHEQEALARYMELASNEKDVTFIGRLGTYRYLDMDVTIAEALKYAADYIKIN